MADCKYLIDRSNLHNVRKQASGYLCDLDGRVTSLELSPDGGVAIGYKYTTSLSGNPTPGYVGANTLDSTTVTQLRMSATTAEGNDASVILADIGLDDIIALFEDEAPNNTSYYTVTALPVNEGGWFSVLVVYLDSVGSLLPSADQVLTTVHVIPFTVREHDDLLGVTPDQHHPQLHDLTSHTDVDLVTNALQQNQGIYWDGLHGTWENRAPALETWATGLANGGELNIAPTPTDVEAIGGVGLIVDGYTDPDAPALVTGLAWDTMNTPIVEPAVAGAITWISIFNTGVPAVPPDQGGIPMFVGGFKQYSQAPSPTLQRQEVFLGVLIYNGVFWKEVSNPKVINQSVETMRELLVNVLPPSSIIQGGGTHSQSVFELRQDAGTIWENNRNWHVSKSDPNREALPARDPLTFQYVNQDFSDVGAPTSTIDPSMYDNGTGAPVAVPGGANTTTIQRLYLDLADNFWVLWGQNTYPNFVTAAASIQADSANTIVPFLLQNSILLGWSVAEKAKADWDVDEAVWLPTTGGVSGGGGGGTPITDHDNLNGITPDNHHNQLHLLYGSDHTDVDIAAALLQNDGLYWQDASGKWFTGRRTLAVGDYVQGATYLKGDELYNNADLSECLLDGTTSFPFVSPTGTPEYLYTGVGMANTPQLAKQVIFGNRYSNPSQPMYVSGYRVNVVAGNAYSVTSVKDPLGTPVLNELVSFTAAVTGWVEFSLQPIPVPTGEVFDLVCTVKEPDPTPVIVTANYDYLTPQNAADPLAGQIQHGRSQQDQMRISYTDDSAIDRTALIQGLSIGDQISDGIIDWAVQSNSDQGTFAIIGVAPASVSVAGIKPFDFETVTATPISVPSDPLYWATSTTPQVEGLIAVDVPYSAILTNTNAYGTDIVIQPAYLPDPTEWRLKIVAGQAGSSTGGFVPTTFAGGGTTGYVPDPLSESNRMLRDDGTWDFVDYGEITNPPTIPTTYWTANGNDIYNSNSGNVGIGLTNPSEQLEVTKHIKIGNSKDNSTFKIGSIGSYIGRNAADGGTWYNTQQNDHVWLIADAEKMRLSSVGLGIGGDPAGRLDVFLASSESDAVNIRRDNNQGIKIWGQSSGNFIKGYSPFAKNLTFIEDTGASMTFQLPTGTERLRIRPDGEINVGSALGDVGHGDVNVAGNYYINGVLVDTFTDAPSTGDTYGRNNGNWVIVSGGGGTISNLASQPFTTQVTITNTGGDDAVIAGATASIAGVMTTSQVQKLADIADEANKYIHPTYTSRNINTSGAQVIDLLTSDSIGSVTNVTTRNMTAEDIGAATVAAGTETLTIAGSNASGTVVRTTVGQMVFLSGRLTWTSRTSSSSQILISGLTYASDYNTGVTASQKNLRVSNSQRNGLSMILDAGSSQFKMYWMIGESDRITAKYQDMQTTGHIDINIMYFSSEVPI